MRNLKLLGAALAVVILSFLTGCSDQITSSGENAVNNAAVSEAESQIDRPLFHTEIRLKPNRSYTFNYSNTGLISFNNVKVERINFPSDDDTQNNSCKDIKVYSVQKLKKIELGCSGSNLNLKEIIVLNTGSSMIDIDVVLSGEKRPIKSTELE